MEKLMKGYVFRLYPNEKQKELIDKSFGCSRYIYNYFLGKNKRIQKCKRNKRKNKKFNYL